MISTGQNYFNARWYDPDLGRFTTEDPIRDGLNWYAYANNNPLRFVDPSGQIALVDDLLIVGAAVGVLFLADYASDSIANQRKGYSGTPGYVPPANRPNTLPSTVGPPMNPGDNQFDGSGPNSPKNLGPGGILAGIAAGVGQLSDKWNEFADDINKILDKITGGESDPFDAASPESILEDSNGDTPSGRSAGDSSGGDAPSGGSVNPGSLRR